MKTRFYLTCCKKRNYQILMDEEYILELLVKKLSRVATEDELRELRRWQELHPEDSLTWEIMASMKGVIRDEHDQAIDTKAWAVKEWMNLSSKIAGIDEDNTVSNRETTLGEIEVKKEYSVKRWYKIAAAIAAVIALAAILMLLKPSDSGNDPVETKLVMKEGMRSKLTLPDGTIAWLNSGSVLTYRRTVAKEREVDLDGEAYFDVHPNENEPFIIHTRKQHIRVLGTKLEVKAYRTDSMEETALLSGKISVGIKENEEKNDGDNEALNKNILLSPGRKVILSKIKNEMENNAGIIVDGWNVEIGTVKFSNRDSTCEDIAWIYNKLIFNKEKFVDLAHEMERWYNVKIYFRQNALKEEVFSGAFEKQNATEALKALQLTTPFSFRQEGKNIYLW